MYGERTLTGFKKVWIGSTPATSPMGAWATTLPSAIADRNAFSAGPTLHEAWRSAIVRVLLMCSRADVPAQNTGKFTTVFGYPAKRNNTKRGARHTGTQRKPTAHAIRSLILLYDPMGSVPDLYMHVCRWFRLAPEPKTNEEEWWTQECNLSTTSNIKLCALRRNLPSRE